MNATHRKPHTTEPAPETSGRLIRWANHYDAVVRLLTLGRDRAIRAMTADMAQIKPGDSVLEVGCGTGEVTVAAKARAGASGKVCGIDAAPEMIDVARSKAVRAGIDIDFRVGLIEAISFPDASVDVVLSSLMMHHLPEDVKRQGLAEIKRVLKPGGHVFVIDMQRPKTFLGRLSMGVALHGMTDTSIEDLPGMMRSAGFTEVQSGDTRFAFLGFVRGSVSG